MKIGVAARIGRVLDHKGWDLAIRTFENGHLLENPYKLEQSVLNKYPDLNPSSKMCSTCGAIKPSIGRTGVDGITEIRHLKCYPGIKDTFEAEWNRAPRLSRDAAWRVDFDPLLLRPGGFVPAGEPWRQPPKMDSSEYGKNTCNVICIKNIPAEEVLAFLDTAWVEGKPDLRQELWKAYGEKVCRMDGEPSPKAKGSEAKGERKDVESKL